MDSKTLIQNYYRGWLESDRQQARSLLTDDLKFRSPMENFDGADDFMETCWQLAQNFNSMEILHEVYDRSSAYLVYRGEGFCCGELIKIRDGRISEIYVTFDPTR